MPRGLVAAATVFIIARRPLIVNTFFKLFLIFFKKISEGEIPLIFIHLRLLLCNDMNLDRIDLRGIRFSDDTVKGDLHDIVLFEVIS